MREPDNKLAEDEQESLEDTISDLLEAPMFILAMIMLVLLIVDLAFALSPEWRRILLLANSVIWWIFVLEYAVRVFLADNRIRYIKRHAVDALFIFVPFLRVFRVLRAVRSIRLLKAINPAVIGRTYVTTRRGLRQLASTLGEKSFPYVLAVTIIIALIGSLLMLLLERGASDSVIKSYGDAVWWAVGVITTVGNEMYPVTAEGRIIATLLMIYGIGIFGYVAATLATYFIRYDNNQNGDSYKGGLTPEQEQLLRDISANIDRLNKDTDKYD
ncbi:MAG: ion transporter [Armatimonadota bacterium]